MELKIQQQYDKIYSYFKTTCEPFDFLDWNGIELVVYYKNLPIEKYQHSDLVNIIPNFEQNQR